MLTWSITIHDPSGVIHSFDTGEAQFDIGTETAPDVLTVHGDGVLARHARVWIGESGLQVEGLGGGTLVNGQAIHERVLAEYPSSVQVGDLTLIVELRTLQPMVDASTPSSPEFSVPPRSLTKSQTGPERTSRQGAVDGTPVSSVDPSETPSRSTQRPDAPLTGGYTLVREIARGGMGQIYYGEDSQLDRQVAVKVSSMASGGEDPRFSREAKVLAHLAHPNIVPIYAIGVDGMGRPFYSMKLVKGRTLQAVLDAIRKGDAVAVQEYTRAALLTVFRKVCDAMAFAHAKGVLHRDLKPDNIMVGEYGEVLVMDWGLAKIVGGTEEVASGRSAAKDIADYGMTMEGEIMGTPQYMSPEQAEGMVEKLDARSDIYALGGILYAILTLRPPIEGKTLNEVLTKVKQGDIRSMCSGRKGREGEGAGSPSALEMEVPEALRSVTLKAMATDRTQRYASVEAFAGDIEAYQNGFATSAEHAGLGRLLWLLIKRNKAVAGMCAVLLLAAAFFSVRLLASERAARESASVARLNEQRAVEQRRVAQIASAKAQVALAQNEDQAKNPQEMRRVLDEVPPDFRDQHWAYLDAKLAPPSLSFEIPEAPVEAAFPTNKAAGCFLTIQRNGAVRYLDPAVGFGSPLFRLDGATKEMVFAFYEEEGRVQLAIATNRTTRVGEKTYPASFEMREVPSGKLVYKVGMDRPCATVDFSPQGNLVCVGRRSAPSGAIEMRNAHSGEIVWEGGSKETVSSKFSPDEKRLVCAVDGKGFQDLDAWTGVPQSPFKPGSSHGVWGTKADCLYNFFNRHTGALIRGVNPKDGALLFEHPTVTVAAKILPLARGTHLFLASSVSSNWRVVEYLEALSGLSLHTAYLPGDYSQFVAHGDEFHLLCLSANRAAFQRWGLTRALEDGLPRMGPVWFVDGDSKVAGCRPSEGKTAFHIVDLKTPRKVPETAFLVPSRTPGISSNKARDLFCFKGGPHPDEWVIARVEAKGIREVARWKSSKRPWLSCSGERAWSEEGLHETNTGKVLQKCERADLGRNEWTQWADEQHVLELTSLKKRDESGEFSEGVLVRWDVETGKILVRLSEQRAQTFGVSPDGRWLAEGGKDGRLRIRSAQTLEIREDYKAHDATIVRVFWHPTKPVVFTCSKDKCVKVWDLNDGRMLENYRVWDTPWDADASAKGDLLAVVCTFNWALFSLDLSSVRD